MTEPLLSRRGFLISASGALVALAFGGVSALGKKPPPKPHPNPTPTPTPTPSPTPGPSAWIAMAFIAALGDGSLPPPGARTVGMSFIPAL